MNNSDENEQTKSNKTGSHITGRATNGQWIGSNFSPLCLNKKGEKKAISSGQKASCHFCPKCHHPHQQKYRSVWNFVWREGSLILMKEDSSFIHEKRKRWAIQNSGKIKAISIAWILFHLISFLLCSSKVFYKLVKFCRYLLKRLAAYRGIFIKW